MFKSNNEGQIDIDKSIRHLLKDIKDIELEAVGNDGSELYSNGLKTLQTPLNIQKYE